MTNEEKLEINAFNAVVVDSESYLFASRNIDLQKNASVQVEKEISRLKILKAKAVSEQNEVFANVLLGCLCVADSIYAELNMWVSLKEGNADKAWDHLISAQIATTGSMKADPGFEHLEHRASKLNILEQVLFPKPIFVSSGLIVGYQECSICGHEYGECNHIAGKPYLGNFCCIIARDLTADHVAMVENPADKRCRVTITPVEGGQRNWMSWVVTPDEGNIATTDTNEVTARFL